MSEAPLSRQQRRQRDRLLAKAGFREGDTCPRCGGRVYATIRTAKGGQLDACPRCRVVWEREERADPHTERCDNCAFRPGSPEQRDPEKWRQIVEETVKKHGIFYCHKRVPATIGEKGYEFQHEIGADGVVCNATECVGWLEAVLARATKSTAPTADCPLPIAAEQSEAVE
jgi:hypothetical protein